MMNKRTVLFLCTGNSCRSQMAEAVVNDRLGQQWQAYSAGTDPAGNVHEKAIQVLEEIGIHHQGSSKHIDELKKTDFDVVITVCDDAAENCPLWLGQGKRSHIGFPDPAKAEGTEEEVVAMFRQVRDAILEKVIGYLQKQEIF